MKSLEIKKSRFGLIRMDDNRIRCLEITIIEIGKDLTKAIDKLTTIEKRLKDLEDRHETVV